MAPEFRSARVLLIDDDEKLLALLNDYVVAEEFAVRIETEATRGVVQALTGDHAIVVLDVAPTILSRSPAHQNAA